MLGDEALRAENGGSVKSWAQLVDQAKEDKALDAARAALVEQARKAAALPIVRRVHRLDDVGKNRTWLDGRANRLEPEIKETFALAMSDMSANGTLARELPLLAAAYRLTGEDIFRRRLIEQLEETAAWSPLQRPGWTCFAPGNRLPADGKDGNWLATGLGVRAVADALGLMPAGSLWVRGPADRASFPRPPREGAPTSLRARLEQLLAQEIAGVVDDWQTKRPWFVAGDNPVTNQWMLPTEGLVRACLVLGVEKHAEAYELGVRNFLRALDAHGPAGEFEEGIGYASFTVTSMLHTAHAMAAAGDRRAIDHPFLRSFPTWMVEHIQPGGMLINCFDAGPARAVEGLRLLLSLLAVCTGSEVAQWALATQANGPSADIAGLLCRGLPPVGEEAPPPLFASYERAARVNWRDSWKQDATGVWVRGGHPLDQHDHHDRGHVNFISRGRPILIEAGTPSYDNPRMASHYKSGVGHNVLQVGDALPERRVAPITVQRLDATGGDVAVQPTACYQGVKQWKRRVRWTSKELTVTDEVALADGKQDTILFRWHLGAAEKVGPARRPRAATARLGIGGVMFEGGKFAVRWRDATMTLEGSEPLEVSQEMLPDNTLNPKPARGSADALHTCVIVRTREKAAGLRLVTRVMASPTSTS